MGDPRALQKAIHHHLRLNTQALKPRRENAEAATRVPISWMRNAGIQLRLPISASFRPGKPEFDVEQKLSEPLPLPYLKSR
jgi:hypothetical protein